MGWRTRDRFMPRFEELSGSDGQPWELAKELTWDTFQEVLAQVQRGKAVGADGFAIELLLKADTATQRVFWEALRADIARGTIPDSWHVVLYVLLVKPPPNNASCVSGRREIALMAQGMKLLMHALRRTAYRKLSARLRSEPHAVGTRC